MSNGSLKISPRLTLKLRRPGITIWNRLEPRPRSENFERSLHAEVRDALWMLARQNQLGEFKGEDKGSATLVKVKIQTTRITRYAQGGKGKKAQPYNEDMPLEARVEREPIPFNLKLKAEMGRHWLRLLSHYGLANLYRKLFVKAFPIVKLEKKLEHAGDLSQQKVWQMHEALAGRSMDGEKFYSTLITGIDASATTVDDNGTILKIDNVHKNVVANAQKDFLKYYRDLFNQPEYDEDSAWVPSHLEYQFACSAPEPDGKHTDLVADEYYQGNLDWYSFNVQHDPRFDPDPKKEMKFNDNVNRLLSFDFSSKRDSMPFFKPWSTSIFNDSVIKEETLTVFPGEAQFSGMPNSRWWEYEDNKFDFGDINAKTTDISKLILAEFGLVYGNDWLYLPFTVPWGSLCEIKGIVVTNTFGERTLIRPTGEGEGDGWQKWNMFGLTNKSKKDSIDKRLFIPPVTANMVKGPLLEKITFLKDEMANMAWGVESIIPNELGEGVNGYESATDLVNFIMQLIEEKNGDNGCGPAAPPTIPPKDTKGKALIKYILGNTVPENWIPLIPVHKDNSNREIQLQRAAMLRLLTGVKEEPINPRGTILNPETGAPYYIYEEEIPRAGAVVTRAFQRVRWHDGTTHLWLGRQKTAGLGEGSSGLKFDQIEDISTEK